MAPKPIQSSSCDVRVSACVSVLFPLSKKQYSEHESSFSKETEVLKDIFKIFGEIQRVRDSWGAREPNGYHWSQRWPQKRCPKRSKRWFWKEKGLLTHFHQGYEGNSKCSWLLRSQATKYNELESKMASKEAPGRPKGPKVYVAIKKCYVSSLKQNKKYTFWQSNCKVLSWKHQPPQE